ncbi:MAG: hypothetical protein GY714_15260, partial [Desulfobacterales bacterium]|nr:hypothetical protein [Desulfobacterales bacterium]
MTGEGIIAAPSSFDVVTATIVVAGDLVGPEAITIANSGGLELHAHTPFRTGVYTFTEMTAGLSGTLRLVPYDDGDGDYDDDYELELRVETLTVAMGGTVSAEGQGYGVGSGPGAGGIYGGRAGGGGHGGAGGQGPVADAFGGTTYGSVYQPATLGSGAGDYASSGAGGGAMHLLVS